MMDFSWCERRDVTIFCKHENVNVKNAMKYEMTFIIVNVE